MKISRKFVWIPILLLFLAAADLQAQTEKKILTLEDYTKWQRITSALLSPDGKWISYGYQPNDGDNTVFLKNLTSNEIFEIPGGARPAFSNDSKWAAYMIDPLKEEKEKLKKDKKPIISKAELIELSTGNKYTVESASSFQFSKNSLYYVVKKRKSDPKAKHDGSDLIFRSLKEGSAVNVGNVDRFAFNKPGTHLAYTVDAEEKVGNGIYLWELGSGKLRSLDTGMFDYTQLTWDKEGTALAVLKGTENKDLTQVPNILLTYTGINRNKIGSVVFDPEKDSTFPEDMVVSGFGSLSWNKDSTKVFLGIKEQKKKEKPGKEKVANVDVWHWKDEELQSAQMVRARRNREFTYLSVFHLQEKRFVRLADEDMRSVNVSKDGLWGIGSDAKPYSMQFDLSPGKADYYRVNTLTGERSLIEKMLERPAGSSPDGSHFLYLKDKELYAYNVAAGVKSHLATGRPGFFVNEDDDRQYDAKPAYRPAGWTEDGKYVLMNHKFDLYLLSLDGSGAANVTREVGEKNQIKFGYVRLDPEEEFIDTSQPILLSAYGEWTKKSGFYSLKVGSEPKSLVFEDKRFGRPRKAKDVDKLIYTSETFVEFPDYYLSSLDFRSAQKITDANPQQVEYAWGRRLLVDYESTRGKKLQATLTLPADYKQGKQYPMLVYFYEKMSQRHHQYSMPVYDDRPHMSTYASDGYLVLMPDIVYADGTPGTNAMECLIPAVEKVIELGYADPKHIGLQGHSWGGYESSFIVTQTDKFACVVTGAPLTSLVSMYNILYKRTGNTNQPQIQYGQGRMGATPWTNLDRYIQESPVHQAEGIKVPFMILHGTEDGAVDWNQGLEFYVSARRLGKEVILLSYPGEPHHLSKIENQKDFQIRMKQYFDHYLKGAEAPDWMVKGVPFLEKKGGN